MALIDYQKFSKPVKIEKVYKPMKRTQLKRGTSKLKQSTITKKKGDKAKRTNFDMPVAKQMYERDDECCILCGSTHMLEKSHLISRADYGLGILENGVLLCKKCHTEWHANNEGKDNGMYDKKVSYLRSKHDNWDSIELQYGSDKLKR